MRRGKKINRPISLGKEGFPKKESVVAAYEKERPDVKVELIMGPAAWEDHVSRFKNDSRIN